MYVRISKCKVFKRPNTEDSIKQSCFIHRSTSLFHFTEAHCFEYLLLFFLQVAGWNTELLLLWAIWRSRYQNAFPKERPESISEILFFEWRTQWLARKVKVKALPITGHEGPKGEYRYSSTVSWPRRLGGSGWSATRSNRFTPGKGPVSVLQDDWYRKEILK